MSKKILNNVVVYQTKNGSLELKGDFKKDTLWANQTQIAEIFDIERSVATKHIGKILKEKEVDFKSNVQKMHIANSNKPVNFYSLDMILAVGYRANSAKAIQFRKWATKTLRQHITEGYTINKKRISINYDSFLKAVEEVKLLLPMGNAVDADSALELVKMFAYTWFSLDAYDKSKFPGKGLTKKQVLVATEDLEMAIMALKSELLTKNEASELFAIKKSHGGLDGIVGNIFQSFDGKDLYPTVEEKAAHLLYFIVKNHPFTDGNKRSGAFAFVWFLKQAGILDINKMTPEALTTLTLLIAESKPNDKNRMVGLVLMLLNQN